MRNRLPCECVGAAAVYGADRCPLRGRTLRSVIISLFSTTRRTHQTPYNLPKTQTLQSNQTITMLTQPLPYNLPPSTSAGAATATYEPINTRPSLSARRSTSSTSSSPRKLSLNSIRSTTSWNSTSTWTSNASSRTSKSLKSVLRRLRCLGSSGDATTTASTTTLGGEDEKIINEDDELAEILHRERRQEGGRRKTKKVARNPDAENMFTWAALGAYSYPGAGPLVGWF